MDVSNHCLIDLLFHDRVTLPHNSILSVFGGRLSENIIINTMTVTATKAITTTIETMMRTRMGPMK